MNRNLYFFRFALLLSVVLAGRVSTFAQCTAPSGLTGTVTSCSTANVMWSAASGAMGYEYFIDTVGAPGTGTPTSMTSAMITGLVPSKIYFLWVRSDCGMGMYSSWTGPFTLPTPPCGPCAAPTPMATVISCDSVDLMWGSTGAGIYEYVVDTSASSPVGAGAPTPSTSAGVGGLTASTSYYMHVRANCSGTYSIWSTLSFTTPACAPSCLTPGGITTTPGGHKVDASWTAVAGAMGYEYVVNTTSSTPTSAGTMTTSNTVSAAGLTPLTAYYFHVRSVCSMTDMSAWSTANGFTTTSALGVDPGPSAHDPRVTVYPNPSRDNIIVMLDAAPVSGIAMQIESVDGRVVKTISANSQKISVDMSSLNPGMYFLRCTTGAAMQVVKITKL